jgi:hypothetical protein
MMLHAKEADDGHRSSSVQASILTLPCETLLQIFSFLPLGTVVHVLPYVCRGFNAIVKGMSPHNDDFRLALNMPGFLGMDDLQALCRQRSKTCTALTVIEESWEGPTPVEKKICSVVLSTYWERLTSLTIQLHSSFWDECDLVEALRSGTVASLTCLVLDSDKSLDCSNLTNWKTPILSRLTMTTGKNYRSFLRRAPIPRPFDKMKLTYLSLSWVGYEISSDNNWSVVQNEDPAFPTPFRTFVVGVLPLSVTSLHLRSEQSIRRTGDTFLSPEFKNVQELSLQLNVPRNPPVLGLGHAKSLRKLAFRPYMSVDGVFKLCAEPYSALARIEDLDWPLFPKPEDDTNEDVLEWCGVPFGRMASLRTVRLNVEKGCFNGDGHCASLFGLPNLENVSIWLDALACWDYEKLSQSFGSVSFGNIKSLKLYSSAAPCAFPADFLHSPIFRAFPNLLRLHVTGWYMLVGSDRAAMGPLLAMRCPRLEEFELGEIKAPQGLSELKELENVIRDGFGPSWKSRLTVCPSHESAWKYATIRFYMTSVH